MERPDSGDKAENSSWTNCPLSDSDDDVNYLNHQLDESMSLTTGYVILTLKQEMEDQMSVSEFMAGRLKLLFIQPTMVSLEELKAKNSLKSKGYTSSRSGNESEEVTTKGESEKAGKGATTTSGRMIETFGIPLWKYVVMKRIRKGWDKAEISEQSDANKNSNSGSKKSTIQRNVSLSSITNQLISGPKRPVESPTTSAKISTQEIKIPASQGKRRRDEMNRLQSALDKLITAKVASSDEEVWVVIIDSLFTCSEEVDIVEKMSDKHNFKVVALSSPLNSNVLRTLVAIGQQKKNAMKEKRLHMEITDFDENSNIPIVLSSGIKQVGDHSHTDSEQSKCSTNRKKVTFLNTQDTLLDSESPASVKDWVKQRGKIAVKKSRKKKLLVDRYFVDPSLPKSSNSEVGRRNLTTLMNKNENTLEEPTQSDAESNDSSVFEMGEENLFVCLNQVSKVIKLSTASSPRIDTLLERSKNSLVVIVREVEPDKNNNFSLARGLKEKLLKNKVKSYIIPVQSMLQDLKALQLLKGYAVKHGETLNVFDGYMRLVLAIIAQKMYSKGEKVIIVDLGHDFSIGLNHVRDFCVRCAEVYTLERLPGKPFDAKLENISLEILKSYKNFRWNWNEASESERDVSQLADRANYKNSPFGALLNYNKTDSPNLLFIKEEQSLTINSEAKDHENQLAGLKKDVSTLAELFADSRINKDNEVCDMLEQVRNTLTSKSDTAISSDTLTLSDCKNSNNQRRIKTHRIKKKSSNHANSKKNVVDESKLSTYELRRDLDPTDSESSVHLKHLYSQRPKLLRIQLMPENSRQPSTSFNSKFASKQPSCTDEQYFFKGWVAVPSSTAERSCTKRCPVSVQRIGNALMRVIRPIGSLFTCQNCRNPRVAVAERQQQGYRQILLNPDTFDS